jgi:hypothetical protein
MALLCELLTGDTREVNNYRKHIGEYKAAMAFASMGAEIKSPNVNGSYCIQTHGQIYHFVSPMYPDEAFTTGYGQLRVLDSAEATINALKTNQTKGVWL